MPLDLADDDDRLRGLTSTISTPPSPTFRQLSQHTRKRSASWGPTFVSTAVVPAPSQNEAVNSLISSLTALTDSAKQQLISVQHLAEPRTASRNHRIPRRTTATPNRLVQADNDPAIDGLIASISKSAGLFSQDFERVEVDEDGTIEDAAPAPVAGYAHKQKSRLRAQSRDKRNFPTRTKTGRPDSRNLPPEQSNQTLRPGTSASGHSLGALSLYRARNTSATSLTLSTKSKESKSKKSLKMFRSSKRSSGPDNAEDNLLTTRAVEPEDLQSKRSHSSLRNEVEASPPRPATPTHDLRRPSVTSEYSSSQSPETKVQNALNPALRSELREHLIPSRGSSARHTSSPTKSSNRPGHLSSDSRDLKSLLIDEELIEGENSTVRRIRELQQAREKRHSEWRKDAKKSEKTPKRMSLPSPKSPQRASSMHSSRHSMSDVRADSSAQADTPKLTARVDAQDLSALPVFPNGTDNGPLTPTDTNSDLKRNMSGSPASNLANAKKHQRLSGGVRRSLSLRGTSSDDFRTVTDEVEAFLNAPRLTQRIRHPRTGRTIAFSEIGDPNGFVVLCCVGMGLTRFVTTFYDELAKTLNLRIITPDRPGVGESSPVPEGSENPLAWVDDVAVICTTLGVSRFSLLAHSAGAIYALATALKMPQYVRGKVHLLAPWIPPSQLAASRRGGDIRAANLPTSHKLLSMLPISFMKAANSRFLTTTSASIEPRSKRELKNEQAALAALAVDVSLANDPTSVSAFEMDRAAMLPTPDITLQRGASGQTGENDLATVTTPLRSPPLSPASLSGARPTPSPRIGTPTLPTSRSMTPQARLKLFNVALTRRTWALATMNSNPALDLIICFERRKSIAFNYTDVVRSVVIHHGRHDNRVPLENVTWLSTAMRRCELRILDDEGHGLMASAKVMSSVLTEIGREWEEWNVINKDKEKRRKENEEALVIEQREREREMRRGMKR